MMLDKFAEMKTQLAELATVLNTFKSEAVQLRLLEMIFGDQPTEVKHQVDKPKRSPRNKPAKRAKATAADSDPTTKLNKRKGPSSGTGANATLNQLLGEGFFSKPRTINDIIEHSKHALASTFKANDFSGKLARMTRSKELSRKKNADNQYEYTKP